MSNSCEMVLSVGADPTSFKHVSEKKKTKKRPHEFVRNIWIHMDKTQSYLRSHCKQKGCVYLTVSFLTHFARLGNRWCRLHLHKSHLLWVENVPLYYIILTCLDILFQRKKKYSYWCMLLKFMTKYRKYGCLEQNYSVGGKCGLVHCAFASNNRLVFFKWQVRVKH